MSHKYEELKTYAEHKKDLEGAYNRLVNHPEYVNKTYDSIDFVEACDDWEDAWYGIRYHCTDFCRHEEDRKKGTFEQQLREWLWVWVHNFNHELYGIQLTNQYHHNFRYPEFLDGMLEITRNFLEAKTREEESKALSIVYEIAVNGTDERGSYTYEVQKKVFLTEANTGTKSRNLPWYCNYEYPLIHKRRTKKWWDGVRKKYSKWYNEKELDNIIKEEKEYVRIVRAAERKGLIKEKKV